MNYTNLTMVSSCGFATLTLNPQRISSSFQTVLISRITINASTCPLIILLNILVMVAVKTKRQLRTKSNITLACLATTDLAVGLVAQPLQTAKDMFLLDGKATIVCVIMDVARQTSITLSVVSLLHLFLLSAERYVAIKCSLMYHTLITEKRVIIASGVAWATVLALVILSELRIIYSHLLFIFCSPLYCIMVYFNVAVYLEVRRSDRQVASNQISLEAKEKILKNKKTFYTTTVILFAMLMCYIPNHVCNFAIFHSGAIPANVAHSLLYSTTLLVLLNSLFNPLIYAVRIRYFRVAFFQLLTGKTTTQAEELERRIFGSRKIRVIATAEQRQEMGNRENDGQFEHERLNHGNVMTVQTQTQQETEESTLK